jgi:hypothetical protein
MFITAPKVRRNDHQSSGSIAANAGFGSRHRVIVIRHGDPGPHLDPTPEQIDAFAAEADNPQ